MPRDQLPRLAGNGVELDLSPTLEQMDKQEKFTKALAATMAADRSTFGRAVGTEGRKVVLQIAGISVILLLVVLCCLWYRFNEDRPTSGTPVVASTPTCTQTAELHAVAQAPEPRSLASAVADIGDLVRAISSGK